MKDFFHKNGVLLLVIALLLSLLVGISSALMGGTADPLSNAATTITAPVRSLVSNVLDWAEGVYNYVFRYEELNTELDTFRKQVADLEAQLRESGEAARENQQLRQLDRKVPPLVNAYMALSPSMRVFGTAINREFGDVEETGILLHIPEIYEEKRKRHFESFDLENSPYGKKIRKTN